MMEQTITMERATRRVESWVRRTVPAVARDDGAVEDAVQHGMAEAWRRMSPATMARDDADGGIPESLVLDALRPAAWHAVDAHRSALRHAPDCLARDDADGDAEPGTAPDPSDVAALREDVQRLSAAIDRLPLRERLVVLAFAANADGWVRDMALRRHVTDAAIRVTLHRALRKLRKMLV